MTSRHWTSLLLLAGALIATPALADDPIPAGTDVGDAFAQDEDEDEDDTDSDTTGSDDDALDDILGTKKEATVAEEKKAVEENRIDKTVGIKNDEDLALANEASRRRRAIKVLQQKNFLKIGRVEAGPHVGFVTNDPFINRILVGANVGYHITEVVSFELAATFSPDFGQGDYKRVTRQLVIENGVSPDISKVIWVLNATAQFAPIYGKIAVVGGKIIVFDFYGLFGMGVAGTQDDLEAIQCTGNPNDACTLTASQVHPTSTIGGGFRVAFSKRFATRIEGRSLSYIEALNGTSLEMKNNFMLQAAGTFFFDAGRN